MFALLLLCIAVTSAKPQSRIVGGENAIPGEHGHQVSLLRNGSHSCGGSILNDMWIVSAAHCTQEPSSTYSVVINEYDRLNPDQNEATIDVDTVINHPDYNVGAGSYPNDISLLKLSKPIDVSFTSIPLEAPGDVVGSNCIITGWGLVNGSDRTLPSLLQKTNGTTLSTTACLQAWGLVSIILGSITDKHICINNAETGACNGDSGGPMECKRADGTVVLSGVTSFGAAGCATGTPSVYTRVSAYNDWINEVLASN